MPYIITSTQAHGAQLEAMADPYPPQSRVAVATLDEARLAVHEATDLKLSYATCDAIDALPENGGTVGPLPDGTVIEVEQVDARTFCGIANNSAREYALHTATNGVDGAGVVRDAVDAYNAAQS